MASGFGGRYQGSVVDHADPIGEHRLGVIVPEVWGTEAGAWAVPSLPLSGAATPARQYLGEEVALQYLDMADQPGTRMARITVRPTWVGLLDFTGDRLPGVMAPPDA